MSAERNSAILTIESHLTEGPRTYVVFGVMRGGTSMVAGVMRGLGIDLGPEVSEQNHESALFTKQNSIEEIRETLAQYNTQHAVWGWKFPHAGDYLDAIWDQLRNPHLICVFRDATANARGLSRWGHSEDTLRAVGATLNRQKKNLELIKKYNCPALLISYEKAERHKRLFVDELASWTGMTADYDAFDFEGFMAAESYKDFADYRK